jgi:hypothetical protein
MTFFEIAVIALLLIIVALLIEARFQLSVLWHWADVNNKSIHEIPSRIDHRAKAREG